MGFGIIALAAHAMASPGATIKNWALITKDGIAGLIAIVTCESLNELMYCIVPQQSGRGLATGSARVIIEYAGGDFFASVHPDNKASQKILSNLGFVLEQTTKDTRHSSNTQSFLNLKKLNNDKEQSHLPSLSIKS